MICMLLILCSSSVGVFGTLEEALAEVGGGYGRREGVVRSLVGAALLLFCACDGIVLVLVRHGLRWRREDPNSSTVTTSIIM